MSAPKNPEPNEQDFWILLLILLVTSPITAIFDAMIAAKLWDLLLASQYGSGPTYQTWYGIALLFAWVANKAKDVEVDRNGESWFVWAIVKLGAHMIYGGLVLVTAGLVRLLFGWH
jgi:hypothetical protein